LADDPNRSPLAVSVSRIPAPRPAGLKSAFDQTLAAAAALDPVPEAIPPAEEVASNAAPADESAEQDVGLDGGAAERSVVAKQATQRNMLNLKDTNLVGIFGSQSNRYALIRQPGGSFKKLKVGDRFDGGRIAAITESEVRYEKGGDLLALRMPKI
jgi:Tfp pilus assembly protein PilP